MRGRDYRGTFFGYCYPISRRVWCGGGTNCCTAQSRISFRFVEASSTSLRSHEEFQGNFKDGWTKVVVVVWADLDATPLLHPFATCPPQEDGGTIGEQKPRFRNRIHGDLMGFQGDIYYIYIVRTM